jgi:AAA domain
MLDTPTTDNGNDPDRTWQLRAARGDITSESALELVRSIRTFRDRWEHRDLELAQALDDGDALWPDDTRRWPEPTPIPTYDPDTTAALDQLAAQRPDPIGDMFVNWADFFTKDRDDGDDWTIDDMLARGRGHSIFAKGKTGKSELVLRLVVDHVTDPDTTDVAIILDYEMGDADLYQRLVDDFGYTAATDMSRLHYAQLPTIPPLDTPGGADTLNGIITWVKARHPGAHIIVVIDTIGRAVEGPENENDTILRFYRNTGAVLRRHETTWARLDHTGHEASDRARGGSAKLDDIDVAWELKRTDDGTDLIRRASRLSWVPETVSYIRATDPVTYTRTAGSWPHGTPDVARKLDALGVPLKAGRPTAAKALRDAGEKARNEVLAAALRYRKSELYIARKLSGTVSEHPTGTVHGDNGTTPPLTRGDSGGDSRGQVPAGDGDNCPPLKGGQCPSPTPNGPDPRIYDEEF